jgi:hypothetical protein
MLLMVMVTVIHLRKHLKLLWIVLEHYSLVYHVRSSRHPIGLRSTTHVYHIIPCSIVRNYRGPSNILWLKYMLATNYLLDQVIRGVLQGLRFESALRFVRIDS